MQCGHAPSPHWGFSPEQPGVGVTPQHQKKLNRATAAHPPASSNHSPPPPCPSLAPSVQSPPQRVPTVTWKASPASSSSSHSSTQTIAPQSSGQAVSIHSTATPGVLRQSLFNSQHPQELLISPSSESLLRLPEQCSAPSGVQALLSKLWLILLAGRKARVPFPGVGYLGKPWFNSFPGARAHQEPQQPPPS